MQVRLGKHTLSFEEYRVGDRQGFGFSLSREESMVRGAGRSGFSLVELLAAVMILAILVGLCLPLVGQFRDRSETVKCRAKLKTLYYGAAGYVLEHQSWPSIRPASKAQQIGADGSERGSPFDAAWIEALKPYGVTSEDWKCPAADRERRKQLGEAQPQGIQSRIDYTPTLFGGGAMAPYEWPKHPWFIERAAYHRSGQQIILSNGLVSDVNEIIQREMGQIR
jgi:prepilin-type N-terminal cleavage/methylation domain-containing protein